MTYHSTSEWTFKDEPNEKIVDEIIRGLKENKTDCEGEYYVNTDWMEGSHVDLIIYNIGIFLDTNKGKRITREMVDKKFGSSPKSAKTIIPEVLRKMQFLND